VSVTDLILGLPVEEAARLLELAPLEVIRILAVSGQMPRNLRLDGDDLARVRRVGGIETWWKEPPSVDTGPEGTLALHRAVIAQLLARDVVEPRTTRADNLFRGLPAEVQVALRRWINALIREQVLLSSMAPHGLVIGANAARLGDLRAFALSGAGPLAALAEEV
jgi:hypothetical protein